MTCRHVALAVLFVGVAALFARAEVYEHDDARIRVELRPDWPAAMVGEPLYLSLTIENLGSKDVWYGDGFTRNQLGRPDFLALAVKAADGTVLPVVDPGMDFGGGYGPRRLMPGERQSKRLFLPHWATIEAPGVYTLTCTRTYELFAGQRKRGERATPIAEIPVEVSCAITIDPHDAGKIPALLERWAPPLRGPETDAASEATRALSVVEDPRVIPLLGRGLSSGYYGIMFSCIRALGKFREDLALRALEQAMRLEVSDLQEGGSQLLSNLRACAADTLARSPHPEAVDVLRRYETDDDWTVRLKVVHAAGRRMGAADVALLERRAKEDAHETVRAEAARYLADR